MQAGPQNAHMHMLEFLLYIIACSLEQHFTPFIHMMAVSSFLVLQMELVLRVLNCDWIHILFIFYHLSLKKSNLFLPVVMLSISTDYISVREIYMVSIECVFFSLSANLEERRWDDSASEGVLIKYDSVWAESVVAWLIVCFNCYQCARIWKAQCTFKEDIYSTEAQTGYSVYLLFSRQPFYTWRINKD